MLALLTVLALDGTLDEEARDRPQHKGQGLAEKGRVRCIVCILWASTCASGLRSFVAWATVLTASAAD